MYSPMANPQLTSLAGTGQLTACLLLSPGKEAALVHKTSTDYKTSFSPTLLNNTLSLALHSSSRAFWPVTSCSSQPLCNTQLCRCWSVEVSSTLEPVTPVWSDLWVPAHPYGDATLPSPPLVGWGLSGGFRGQLLQTPQQEKSYSHHLLLPLWILPISANGTWKAVSANSNSSH